LLNGERLRGALWGPRALGFYGSGIDGALWHKARKKNGLTWETIGPLVN